MQIVHPENGIADISRIDLTRLQKLTILHLLNFATGEKGSSPLCKLHKNVTLILCKVTKFFFITQNLLTKRCASITIMVQPLHIFIIYSGEKMEVKK